MLLYIDLYQWKSSDFNIEHTSSWIYELKRLL